MTRSLPKISIITPSFNQGPFIEEALLSVKSQNYPNVEHIVLDGASTDDTVEILRRYGQRPGWEHLHWISEPDHGQTDALNKGFRMATGSIVGWLNSDDRYRPGCFATIAQEFAEHQDADVIYGDYTWIDEKGSVQRIKREIGFNRFILCYHRVLYIPTPSSFFGPRVFNEGNLLDGGLEYSMDYEFFLRLAAKAYRFRHVSSLLADFRWHGQSKSTAHSRRQMAENSRVTVMYSPLLQKVQGTPFEGTTLAVLRAAAASLRYSKKLLRGSYFEEFSPRLLRQNTTRGFRP